jgi:glycine betaine/proline transport system ATP-binding protein
MAAIQCRRLFKIYGEAPSGRSKLGAAAAAQEETPQPKAGHVAAVSDVSFDVREGEIFVIMGLSGSGKSTVLRCLSRLIEPTSGEVIVDGRDLTKMSENELIELRRHKIGMVFQHFGLLPHLDVLNNVAFPLKVQGMATAERRARAREMISLVGLDGREHHFPQQLSGGQQQRVGIARSLATEPDIWLLDEPFSALDPLIRRQLQDEFMRLQRQLHKTIVFVTHDIMEAIRIADRIAIMKDGAIVQIGPPEEIVLNPVDGYVASFTRDVPRSRVLRVGEIMLPVHGTRPRQPNVKGIPASTSLEDAIAAICDQDSVQVLSDNGDVIGTITPALVVKGLSDALRAGHA